MKKNTALQTLIFELRKAAKISGNPEYASGLEYAALSAESKLSKEREDIKDAFNQGYREGELNEIDNDTRDVAECANAQMYFNDTFNQ